ncbi:MAG: gliding motility-associated C-terminal domain-containing protein [Deltaproteobacteria bacterium]
MFKKSLILFFIFLMKWQSGTAQCGVKDTLIAIPDNEKPKGIKLMVEGVSNNDLADVNQCVDKVKLKFEHFQRTELTIDLISPSGQKVRLVGPYNPFSSPNPGKRKWDITFVKCSELANPDPGKSDHFNNNDNWGFLSLYDGVYYPHDYCLESFDFGPVNGTWTFLVYDHEKIYTGNILGYSIEFCDGTVVDCNQCNADPGSFNYDSLTYCINDPQKTKDLRRIMPVKAIDDQKYNFQYIISKNDIFFNRSDSFDIGSFAPGQYKIWGLSYYKADSSKIFSLLAKVSFEKFIDSLSYPGNSFCAGLMPQPVVINIIEPQNTISIPVFLCKGDTFVFQDSIISDPGTYFFNSYYGNCDSTYFINVQIVDLNAGILAPDTVLSCNDNGFVKISGSGYVSGAGMSFKWLEFPELTDTAIYIVQPGNYHFVLYQYGCSDTASIKIIAENDIPSVTYTVQQIDCCHLFGEIRINVTNVPVGSYQWTYEGSNLGINSNSISTNNAGIYNVKVISISGCESNIAIHLPVDTIKPALEFEYNDLTCFMPETTVKLNTSSSLTNILWIETGQTEKDILISDPGIYHVAVTGANCCSALDSVEIKGFKTKPSVAISGANLDCLLKYADLEYSSPDSLISVKWTTPENLFLEGKKIRVEKPGMYYIDIENVYGCTNRDSFEVKQDEDPPDIFIPDFPLFLSCTVDSVRLDFTSADPIIKVEWNGPGIVASNEIFPYAKYEGTYYVMVTGRNHCVAYDSIKVLNDNTVPVIQIYSDTIDCIDKTVNLSVGYSGNYAFEWQDEFNNIYTGPTVTSYIPGFYNLTVRDLSNGCENHFLTEVTVDTLPLRKQLITSSLLDCNHDQVKVYLSDYNGIESVKWYNTSLSFFYDTLKVVLPGKYYVDIIPENKCVYTDSVVVMEGEYINIEPDTFLLTCLNPGQKVVLPGVNPAYSFSWTGPNSFVSASSEPVLTIPGEYYVTVTNGNCTESSVITIYENKTKPFIDVKYDSIIDCKGYAEIEGLTLSGQDVLFSWEGPSFFTTTNIKNFVYHPGKYVFKVWDTKNGCEDSIAINIVLSQDYPVVSVSGDEMTCKTGIHPLIIECQVSNDYSSIKWIYPDGNSSTSLVNTVNIPGQYICIVENSLGCITRDTAYIVIDTLSPAVNIFPPDTLTCIVDSVQIMVSANPASSSFNWTGPYGFYSHTNSIFVLNGGEYQAIVTSQNGCTSKVSVSVPVNRLKPYIFIKGQDINGKNSKSKLEITTTATEHITRWEWPDGKITFEDSLRTILPGMYMVTVTDLSNGCKTVDSIMINIDSIAPDIVVEDYYLPCDTNLIKMHVYSNKPGTIFYWFGPEGFYTEGPTAYTNKSGKYYIFAEGTNGIISKDSLMVFNTPLLPEFEAFGNKITCEMKAVHLKATGVHDDKRFVWTGPVGFSSLEREPLVTIPGIYTLHVVGKNNCEDSMAVTVDVDTLKPEFTLMTRDSLVCDNNRARLEVIESGNSNRLYTYKWDTDNGIIDYGIYSPDPVVIGQGTYKITVTDLQNGCFSSDSILINSLAYDLDSVIISLQYPSCFGYSDGIISIDTVFGGTGPYTFSTDNYYFSNFSNFNSKKAGFYKLFVKDKNGCRLDTTVLMVDGGDVQVSIGTANEEIYIGNSAIINAYINAPNGIRSINWKPDGLIEILDDSLKINFTPDNSSLVSVEVIDSNGCKGYDDLWIRVLTDPDIYIPDIFTPDGDGVNDYFYFKSRSGVKSVIEFKIFDRWGELLYSKDNPRLNVPVDGWDGKYNGFVVNNGVYVFYLKIELQNGKIETFYTDLTLIK